jgi:hypothetical protein
MPAPKADQSIVGAYCRALCESLRRKLATPQARTSFWCRAAPGGRQIIRFGEDDGNRPPSGCLLTSTALQFFPLVLGSRQPLVSCIKSAGTNEVDGLLEKALLQVNGRWRLMATRRGTDPLPRKARLRKAKFAKRFGCCRLRRRVKFREIRCKQFAKSCAIRIAMKHGTSNFGLDRVPIALDSNKNR